MSSILPADNDLAAELILNKMMNGQIKSASGRTVTSGNRALAQELNATAYETSIAVGSVSSAQGYVVAAQTQTSAMISKLTEMRDLLKTAQTDTSANIRAVGDQVADLMKEIDTPSYTATAPLGVASGIKATQINNQALFGTTSAITVDAGMDTKISVLGEALNFNNTTTLGALTGTAGAAGVGTILTTAAGAAATNTITTKATPAAGGTPATEADAVTAGKTAIGAALKEIDIALSGLNNHLAVYAQQYKTLKDRSTILSDLGASFTASANAQTTNASNGSTGLLNSVLGTTTA